MKNTFRICILLLGFLCLWLDVSYAQETLTWEDCLIEAKKNNPDLISAAEGVNIKKAAKDITASALYPQTSLNLSASTAKTSTTSGSSTSDTYSYGASGTQLIFDGFKTINDLKSAEQDLKASQHAYRFASSEVRSKLRNAFINLLKAQELIKVAEDIVKIRKNSLVLINLQYLSGLEHKGALLTAEANLLQAKFELSQAKRNVEFTQRQLSEQMGRRNFKPIEVKGEFVVNETAKEKPDFEELVKNNPEVLEAILKENSKLFGIKSAYGNFSPQLTGSAGANKKSGNWPPENDNWNLGLSLTMPLFEGGLKAAELSQAKATYEQAVADEVSIRSAAIVSLEQTWAALQDAIEEVEVQNKSLEASQERAEIAKAQYSNGFISFDNLIIIEDNLVGSKKAYLESQANALTAEADWIKAKGETLEYAQ